MKPPRVAVLCDYAEENWPSMELVGNMLIERLEQTGTAQATRVQPRMRQWFGPLLRSQAGFNADRLINRQWHYGRSARHLRRFDLFHIVDHSYAQLVHSLPKGRAVVTCHDLDTFRCLLTPSLEHRPWWFRAMVRRTLCGLQKAAAIVCVSNATRDQLVEHGITSPEKITVIHNGVSPCFSAAPDPHWDRTAAQLLGEAGSTIELLHVGSTIPRKRIDVLLRVFARCRDLFPKVRLIRVGSPFTAAQNELARTFRIDDVIRELPAVEQPLLAAIYRRAALLMVTSDAEGFGLPLAEAMQCGTPVVASDIPALREVGGEAVAFCAVGDIDDWTETVLRLLTQQQNREAFWQDRIRDGQRRATQFSWDRNAREVANVYRRILSPNS